MLTHVWKAARRHCRCGIPVHHQPGAGYYFIKDGPKSVFRGNRTCYTFERVAAKPAITPVSGSAKSSNQVQRQDPGWQTLELLPEVTDFARYLVTFEVGLETALTQKVVSASLPGTCTTVNPHGRKENDFRL